MSEDCPRCVFNETESNCPGCFEGSHYKPKPITNYDRIISKTPEELADWLNAVLTANVAPYATIKGANNRGKLLDWLKQEAEGGNLK